MRVTNVLDDLLEGVCLVYGTEQAQVFTRPSMLVLKELRSVDTPRGIEDEIEPMRFC